MTTATRREEYSSNIIRTLHPTTNVTSTTSSSNNLNENIDYLLDDLQNSVTGTSQYLASKNVQHLSPMNTVTYIKERSVSPGRNHENVYKSSSYQYSSSSTNGIGNQNIPSESSQINQLDVLLQDLKKERELSREKDFTSTTYTSGLETERLGTRSPNLSETKLIKDEINIKRDIAYNPVLSQNASKWSVTTSPSEKSHIYEKKIESSSTRDVTFGDTTPILTRSEKYAENKTVPYYEAKSQIITSHDNLPDDLRNVPLSEDILPGPGTKVTTTVRTYTYEIPGEPTTLSTTKRKLFQKEMNSNEISTYPERELPSSVTYKTESYKTTNESRNIPTIQTTKTISRHHDINDIDRSVEFIGEDVPPVETNIHYREVIDSKDVPPTSLPPSGSPGGITYYYKHHESTNTKNTLYGPPGSPPQEPYYAPVQPQAPKTITYRSYSSTKHTTTGEREPLLQPAPFPTDNVEVDGSIEGPPKKLDDLMASLGNNEINSRDLETHVSRKEIDTSVAEKPPPTKNVTGPPVYYPPGREMFMKKEESSAAYRAGGGYASAAAKYEYEAESKSKSKSKSGAAMVPVCLPLCCAMPCSIM